MPNRSLTVYKASAGSGKTYTLTREYILSVIAVKNPETGTYRLNHPNYAPGGRALTNRHRAILAITFTNKATEEMKERITVKLRALAAVPQPGQKEADYAADFMALLGCSRQELAETANRALEQLLHDFQNFNVSTIDAFFQRVLRTFARELDLHGDYELQLDHQAVMRAAVAQMLDDFNVNWRTHADLYRWIQDRMGESLDAGKRANILDRSSGPHRTLVEVVSKITGEDYAPIADDMRKFISAKPDKFVLLYKAIKTQDDAITAQMQTIASAAVEAVEAYGPKHGVTSLALNFLRNHFITIKEPDAKTLANAVARIPDGLRTAKCKCPDDVVMALGDATLQCVDLLRQRHDLTAFRAQVRNLSFLTFAIKYVEDIYKLTNTVLLADTNTLVHTIIDGSDVPFIYERLAMHLHHLLIDEFQDTSALQWANLRPLVANAIDDLNDCLIIGDVKQSIYGFRNSDPALLAHQVEEEDFPGRTSPRGSAPRENTNHRSSREVVEFNNTLFMRLAAHNNAVGYDNVAQALPEKEPDPGYVRIISTPLPEETKGSSDPFAASPQLALMAEEMMRQHCEGGYPWSDIAILSARHEDNAKAIEYLMRHTAIPVLAEEGLFLHKSPVIKLIMALLRLVDIKQTTPEAEKAGGRIFSIADMQLIMSRFEYYTSVHTLTAEQALERALNSTADLDQVVSAILDPAPTSVAEIVENIINRFVDPAARDANSAYLTALQDNIADYARSTPESLHGFLQWWDTHGSGLSIPVGGDVDAVRVMTIHKSKGLEFDCVHIPFPEWPQWKMKSTEWELTPAIPGIPHTLLPPALLIDGQTLSAFASQPDSCFFPYAERRRQASASEQVNVTYVAYTRAARELCIYHVEQPKQNDTMIDAVFECLAKPRSEAEEATPFTIDLAEHFDAETRSFALGRPTKKVFKSPTPSHVATLPPLRPGYPVWPADLERILATLDSTVELNPDISDTPATGPNAQDYDYDPESRERGLLMHDILQNVTTIADIPAAAAAVAARGHYPTADVRKAQALLSEALDVSRPEIARWFRDFDSVVCEQDIYINQDGTRTIRRPDRIVFTPDGTVEIVDYKFTTREQASHISQVRQYCQLLRAMGHADVRGYLWYPLHPGSPTLPVQ